MPRLAGILNCTPDSFSDGTINSSPQTFLDRGNSLIDQGADILDIGGDSTRPGSQCVGAEEEWRRIKPVLEHFAHKIPCSVDTHHVEVARRACDFGASMINDISGRCNDEMVSFIATHDLTYIFMFNAHGDAHTFGEGLTLPTAFASISQWIMTTSTRLTEKGIPPHKLIADPGIGAFISRDPAVSWEVVERFGELPAPAGGLLLGCSRKGFLAVPNEKSPHDRDTRSCIAGALATSRLSPSVPAYLRVHNVAMQRRILDSWETLSKEERSLQRL